MEAVSIQARTAAVGASPEARAAAHAALRAATSLRGGGLAAAATGNVAPNDAQELGELRAVAGGALRLLIAANEQLNFLAALLAGIFVQRHRLGLRGNRNAMYMDVFDAINQRRSVKAFDPSHRLSVTEETTILEAAIQSPTSFNMQNWRFVIVRDPELRK